jgi:hypothetical protein
VVGAGAVAAVLAALPGDMEAEAGPSPASAVARRFPLAWSTPAATPAPHGIAQLRHSDEARHSLFDPQPVYPAPPEVPSWLATPLEPTKAEQDALAALAALQPPEPRATARPRAVLNDAQIASIKERLNLTRAQERHWPALEAALKRLNWKRPSAARASSYTTTPTVDVNAADLDRFRAAAAPLMQSFSAEQKREVRALIAIVGLEKLLAEF